MRSSYNYSQLVMNFNIDGWIGSVCQAFDLQTVAVDVLRPAQHFLLETVLQLQKER